MPDKRSHRLKDHKVLEDVAKHNPDSEDIFQSNLLDTYYPQRPNDLQDVCLYDFVANMITVVQTVGQETVLQAYKASIPQPQTL